MKWIIIAADLIAVFGSFNAPSAVGGGNKRTDRHKCQKHNHRGYSLAVCGGTNRNHAIIVSEEKENERLNWNMDSYSRVIPLSHPNVLLGNFITITFVTILRLLYGNANSSGLSPAPSSSSGSLARVVGWPWPLLLLEMNPPRRTYITKYRPTKSALRAPFHSLVASSPPTTSSGVSCICSLLAASQFQSRSGDVFLLLVHWEWNDFGGEHFKANNNKSHLVPDDGRW